MKKYIFKSLFPIIIFIILIIIYISSAFYKRDYLLNQYDKAINLMNNGYYQESLEIFNSFNNNYKDTSKYVKEIEMCLSYESAKLLYKNKKYKEAIIEFSKLIEYKDSEDYFFKSIENIKNGE